MRIVADTVGGGKRRLRSKVQQHGSGICQAEGWLSTVSIMLMAHEEEPSVSISINMLLYRV